jgi:ParB/RepB/Spo0J family partition protein
MFTTLIALIPLALLCGGLLYAVDVGASAAGGVRFCRLPPASIRPRSNVREEFDQVALRRLGESMRKFGQQQPIVVAPDPSDPGLFLVVAGERRWRAARLVGIEDLECKVLAAFPEDPAELATYQLIENCVREDLRPIEQAYAFQRLMEHRDWTGSHLAAELHLSDAHVSRTLALLRLPDDLAEKVNRGELVPGIAREVSRLDSAESMRAMVQVARDESLTSEQVRDRVTSQLKLKTAGRRSGGKARRAEVLRLEGRWEARIDEKQLTLRYRGPGRSRPRADQQVEALEELLLALRERIGNGHPPAAEPDRAPMSMFADDAAIDAEEDTDDDA